MRARYFSSDQRLPGALFSPQAEDRQSGSGALAIGVVAHHEPKAVRLSLLRGCSPALEGVSLASRGRFQRGSPQETHKRTPTAGLRTMKTPQ